MLNKSSIKVILAFTGMILLGLVSMFVLNSMQGDTSGSSEAKAGTSLTK